MRLVCAVIAGGLIGLDRGEHGRPAGMRTTLLVCVAATMAMILVNILLSVRGKADDGFVNIDPMRLPLGVLSGMGFIGAGAILRRENVIVGVTTAATLWFVTMLGLSFGAGQYALGIVGLVIGLVALMGLKRVELQLVQERTGVLFVTVRSTDLTDGEIRDQIRAGGYQVISVGVAHDLAQGSREITCEVRWRARVTQADPPPFVGQLCRNPSVSKLKWSPLGLPAGME